MFRSDARFQVTYQRHGGSSQLHRQPTPCRWCSDHGHLFIVNLGVSLTPFGIHTVVGSILLAADQQLRVEQLAVGSSTDLVNGLSWLASSCAASTMQRTEGSKSTKMERGTYLPLPVSVKKVSNEPPSLRSFASGSGRPSALRPCSRRYLRWQISRCAS